MVKATTPRKENRGMMNHHLSATPHGPPPMLHPRRQHEVPYSSAPPNMRSAPGYMGYHHRHAQANGSMPPPYGTQHYQQWCQYHQVPPSHPPQPYQPYA